MLVIEPGRVVKGKNEISAFSDVAFNMDINAKQIKANIMQADDIALFTSKWSEEGVSPEVSKFINEKLATSFY